MARKKILGSQVKRLLSGVSDHGIKHLVEVEADLLQTTLLLGEAIQKLGSSFMSIHAAVCAQQDAVKQLLNGVAPSPESIANLNNLHEEIGQHVNAAVTGMQFQDMTSQLIDRTMKRVMGLREFLGTLGSGGAGMLPESDNEEIVALLSSINMALAIQSLELKTVLRKAVNQNHLDSGDIELF
ncbi:MAG: chemotaxis protein [Pseudomonadota bacterium]